MGLEAGSMSEARVLGARMRHSKFDGANGARPRKLLQQILKLASLLEEGTSEEIEAAHKQFLKDLALYEFGMSKIQVVADTSLREVQAYKSLQADLQSEMEKTSAEIEKLKERVAHERIVRKNKEEYTVLAKTVEHLPSRKQTEKDKTELQDQLIRLEEQTSAQ